MPSVNVSLTPELMQVVQSKIDSGLYDDASDVVCDAIRQLDARDHLLYDVKLDHLRQALAPGLQEAATGEFADYSLEDIIAELDQETEA
jgi:antitoxin ParD1/3/4